MGEGRREQCRSRHWSRVESFPPRPERDLSCCRGVGRRRTPPFWRRRCCVSHGAWRELQGKGILSGIGRPALRSRCGQLSERERIGVPNCRGCGARALLAAGAAPSGQGSSGKASHVQKPTRSLVWPRSSVSHSLVRKSYKLAVEAWKVGKQTGNVLEGVTFYISIISLL